jgi:DNA-binding NarL/FixJ family response regulator
VKQNTASTRPYRILIADDHSIVRSGLRAFLTSEPGIEICGEAANGREVLAFMENDSPDMVVMDLTMPEMDGLEAIRTARQMHPKTAILILTMHSSNDLVRECMRLGVRGYILKADADVELRDAVARIRRGGTVFSCQIAEIFANSFVGAGEPSENGMDAKCRLTERETEVVRLLAEGKSSKEVAAILALSIRTAEAHRNRIMRKMKFSAFSELVRFAVRTNLIEL